MLLPKRVKFRKQHRGRMTGKAMRGNTVSHGEYGLQALQPAWITSNQIEAARIAMTRYIKRGGQVWIKIFPDKPATRKPLGTRMGKGKGAPEYWVAVVKPGREIKNMTVDELNSKLAELKQELFNLRFQHAVNQLENPKRLQAVKKDIARVKTFIRKQESNVQ